MQNISATSRVQANIEELFKGKLAPGDAYVKFQLASIAALLSMKQVQESLIVGAERITPLPNMPESAIGMINSRDRVFCIFDLALLLGVSSELANHRQYSIIVFQTIGNSPIYVGMAVSQLQGIVRISNEQIQLADSSIDEKLMPYMMGMLKQEKTAIPILEFEDILRTLRT